MNEDVNENRENVGIDPKHNIKIGLTKAVPSGYPISLMKDHMTKMGLSCKETTEDKLTAYKATVMNFFKDGPKEIFGIYKDNGAKLTYNQIYEGIGTPRLFGNAFLDAVGLTPEEANGSWRLDDDPLGYRQELHDITYPQAFDKLKTNYSSDFNGTSKKDYKVINEPTAQAITDTFRLMAQSVVSVVASGIKLGDFESVVSTIFGENESTNIKDYEKDDTLFVYMVIDYKEAGQDATSVAGLSIKYKVHITSYLNKGDNKDGRHNDADITIEARFVSYSDDKILNRDYDRVHTTLKTSLYSPAAVMTTDSANGSSVFHLSEDKAVEVYKTRPEPSRAILRTGLPLVDTGIYAESMIFYSPDVETISCVDNSDSGISATSTGSILTGFEKISGFTIPKEDSYRLSYNMDKGISFDVAITSAHNKNATMPVKFKACGGKKTTLNQSVVKCSVIRYDHETGMVYYVDGSENKFYTSVIKTTEA